MSAEATELVFQTRQTLRHYCRNTYNSGVGLRIRTEPTSQHAWTIFNFYYYYTRFATPLLYARSFFALAKQKNTLEIRVYSFFFFLFFPQFFYTLFSLRSRAPATELRQCYYRYCRYYRLLSSVNDRKKEISPVIIFERESKNDGIEKHPNGRIKIGRADQSDVGSTIVATIHGFKCFNYYATLSNKYLFSAFTRRCTHRRCQKRKTLDTCKTHRKNTN